MKIGGNIDFEYTRRRKKRYLHEQNEGVVRRMVNMMPDGAQ